MGIVSFCPNGHRVKVKDHLAGRKGICPRCGSRFRIPSVVQPAILTSKAAAPAPAALMPSARIVSFDAVLAAGLPPALPLSGEPVAIEAPVEPAAAGIEAASQAVPIDEQQLVPAVDQAAAAAEPDWGLPDLADVPAADVELLADHPPSTYAAIDEQPELAWYVSTNGAGRWQSADAVRRWLDSGQATGGEEVWRADWKSGKKIYEAFPEIDPGAGW